MTESFLRAVAARSAACRRTERQRPDPFVFELWYSGNDDEPWSDVWVNSFAKYGGVELQPPPLQNEWWPCTSSHDPALRAVLEEDLEAVRKHYKQPSDLLRWRENYFTCGCVVGFTLYESVLHLAFAALNLEVLKHLFAIAPLTFMQLMGMTNTEDHMGEGATLPLLYSISLEQAPKDAAKQKRERCLPAVMSWLCATGLMTPVLADVCFPCPDGPSPPPAKTVGQYTSERRIIEAPYARCHLPAAALSTLQRWERLSRVQQRVLTLASFADVMRLPEALCRLPWAHERVLWIGAHDESSLWHKLSPELLRFVVSAACGTWWVKHAAAEVVARLGVDSDERDR